MNKYKKIAVLLMAGSGNRFGTDKKEKKQFLEINGKPLFLYSLNSLVFSDIFEKVIIVCPKEEKNSVAKLIPTEFPHNLISIIEGGESRNDSVFLSLQYIEHEWHEKIDETTFVFLHDAARPYLPESILNEMNSLCDCFDAIVPAIPLTDSIMQNGVYVPRDNIMRIQTPQAFCFSKLFEIYCSGFEKQTTDDFSKAIHAGLSHKIIQGSPLLYKITFPEDIAFFKKIL